MGGDQEVYTSLEDRRMFSYANVRKASYRGSKLGKIRLGKSLDLDHKKGARVATGMD